MIYGPHPTERRVSAPVTGFSPFRVGFLQIFRRSKLPMYASVKSAFSKSAPSKFVPVKTVFVKIAPLSELPLKVARSTIALVKSAPSKLEAMKQRDEKQIGKVHTGQVFALTL